MSPLPKDIIKLMDYWRLGALRRWVSEGCKRSADSRAARCATRASAGVTKGISSPASSSLQLVLAGTERSVNTYYCTHKSSDRRQHLVCTAAGTLREGTIGTPTRVFWLYGCKKTNESRERYWKKKEAEVVRVGHLFLKTTDRTRW